MAGAMTALRRSRRCWLLLLASSIACSSTSEPPADPADLEIFAGNGQSAPPGNPVPVDPSVIVSNVNGRPLAGVTVTFAVASGGGVVFGAVATTGSNGVATVGQWNLGSSPGSNTLTASVDGLPSVTFTATANPAVSQYTIDLRILGSMSPSQAQSFQAARDRLQRLIVGDQPNIPVNRPAGDCLPNQPAMNETIDDLVIFAEVVAIDGPGMILGQAGPCFFRMNGAGLPAIGIMQFDVADLNTIETQGLLQFVVLHEMLHVIGFGSVWNSFGLLAGSATTDPFFTGSQAIAAFNSIGGNVFIGNKVPVEGTGGPGTRNSHWRETVFKAELMTGFLNNGANPLSIVTASSLADLGYTVDQAEADAFAIVPPFTPPPVSGRTLVMFNDLWTGPRFEIDEQGTVRRVPRR